MTSRTPQQGFTLIEVMMATVLIGIAIAALVGANGAHTMVNDAGARLSTAEFLVEQIRERTAALPVVEPGTAADDYSVFGAEENDPSLYDDVDDYNGKNDAGTTFNPPIDAAGNVLTTFNAYTQEITVKKVDPSDFQTVLSPDTATSDFIRVTVKVLYRGTVLTTASWIRARY